MQEGRRICSWLRKGCAGYTGQMRKQFKLKPEQIVPIIEGLGSCLASDQITVDGRKVGYMYREKPDRPDDSGWRFFSGDESQEYCDSPAHFEIYNVNTIANYDAQIIPLLASLYPSAWVRSEGGAFEEVSPPNVAPS